MSAGGKASLLLLARRPPSLRPRGGPIPPKGASLNFPMSDKLKELIKAPSDAPAEAYNKK